MTQGYNWEKDESNMRPTMLFHGNIKAHVYKSADQKKNQEGIGDFIKKW